MRVRWIGWRGSVGGLVMAGVCGVQATGSGAVERRASPGGCTKVVLEGEVRAGQEFRHAVMTGLELRLEPLPAGWVLRVQPMVAGHGGEDFAEMATPPYRSVSPLLVSTDFSFRAQDALGWNPRRFRFAANERSFAAMRDLRRAAEAGGATGPSREAELARMASEQPEGTMEILDAHLVPGTADQTGAAGMVAGHFLTTAHTLDQPPSGRASALGQITWMRFRVSLALPQGAKAAAGSRAERSVCAGF